MKTVSIDGDVDAQNAISGADPTIVSCNASVVKIYNATNSLARFRKKIFYPM
jgi:hypothetical protein